MITSKNRCYYSVRTRLETRPKINGLRPKKPKIMNLWRVGWKNLVKMSWITNKVDSIHKDRETDWIKFRKIVLGTGSRRSILIYPSQM